MVARAERRAAPKPARIPPGDRPRYSADEGLSSHDDISRHLVHLEVERRLAPRTLAMYGEAFERLRAFAHKHPVPLREVQVHHVRRWAAQLHAQGLAGLAEWGRAGAAMTPGQACALAVAG